MWLVLVVFFRGLCIPPSRRDACRARHWEYVRALADGLNFTQAARAVGVSKRTGKVWRNGRTRSSGRCERASIAPQAHWYRLYMKCQPASGQSTVLVSSRAHAYLRGARGGPFYSGDRSPVGAFGLDGGSGAEAKRDYFNVLQPLHRSHAGGQAS